MKIDCDGCEVAALAEAPDALSQLRDRVLEFNLEAHFRLPALGKGKDDNDEKVMLRRAARMANMWRQLYSAANMVPFSKEPNIQYSRGDAVEYSFANKKMVLGGE